ncbi:MAG TPA: aminotransferase class V-fold PLP-dependent enzyme [Solirubrobacteraceae bacterium]|nr:aminotransferase class V-fold PLP-dependent enzyme [Solirubrobacteraceae bacterium]
MTEEAESPATPPPPTDPEVFRTQFPVLERVVYLNAGTEGPAPRAAEEAATARIEREVYEGRCGRAYFEELLGLAENLRARYAAALGCDFASVALTGSTTDGVNTVIAGLDLRAGEEILTTDEEHPGLLAPLARARIRHDVTVRVVPWEELLGAVSPATRLIACSHVSWVSGRIMDVPALAATGVPVLVDGAQGLGAVPVNVGELGCAFYAASGQKWLCGPEGSGCLYVSPEHVEDLLIPWPSYGSVVRGSDPLDLEPAEGATRFDHGFPPGVRSAWAVASLEVLEAPGWEWVHGRAADLALALVAGLEARGLVVAPRGRSTLVSWRVADPEAEVLRLADGGVIVRSIPGRGLVRASVGAWCSAEDIDTLARLAAR